MVTLAKRGECCGPFYSIGKAVPQKHLNLTKPLGMAKDNCVTGTCMPAHACIEGTRNVGSGAEEL